METALFKHFVKKTIRKVVVFTILTIVVVSTTQSAGPVISNQMALTQMQNSDEMFILMNTYFKVRRIVNLVYAGIAIWFTYTIGRDVYKFTKAINAETKKEN